MKWINGIAVGGVGLWLCGLCACSSGIESPREITVGKRRGSPAAGPAAGGVRTKRVMPTVEKKADGAEEVEKKSDAVQADRSGQQGEAQAQAEKPSEPKPAPGEVTEVMLEQVFALRQAGKLWLVDTRRGFFFNLGHIDGALSRPIKEWDEIGAQTIAEARAAAKQGMTLVTYCASVSCPDSYTMAKDMAEAGLDVSVYKGGWKEWKDAGLE